jgi:RimJ/RimL family protein N-acetyltransferase
MGATIDATLGTSVGPQPVLETERLILRPYGAGDLDPMAAMFGDPEVTAFTFLGLCNRDQTAAVLADYMSFLADRGYGMLASWTRRQAPISAKSGSSCRQWDRWRCAMRLRNPAGAGATR